MSNTSGGNLVGGEELRQLIKVISEAPSQMQNDKVYIYPCRKNLDGNREIYDSELNSKAFEYIYKDLVAKESDIDKFVSIRIHISRTVWRQRTEASVPPIYDDLNHPFHLDNSVNEFWITTRCNDSKDEPLKLGPGDFVVLPSLEEIRLPSNIYGFLQTRTTVALKGLDVTPTNLIVPGFSGCLHLQVRNHSQTYIQIPDFFALGELFIFSTIGSYSGAGPAYQEAAKSIPPTAKEVETSGTQEASLKRVIKAIVIYTLVILPIIGIAYYLLSSFPSVPKEILSYSLLTLFIVCSVCFVVIAFGKDIVSFAADKYKDWKK